MSEEEIDFLFDPEDFDPYQTLNVTPDATIDEIQESYKKLSKTFHPDRGSSSFDINTLNASRQQFESITKAKEILCNSQIRRVYDDFGLKGIQMMQRNIYHDLHSMQIGERYRNDEAVTHLIKYYLKREATIELDKLVSSYGHCELGIDATSLYEEFVDLIFRHETIPQFIHNLWNGIPTLQIVVNQETPIYNNEPVRIVDDDYDFDQEENEYIEYEEDDGDDGDLSMSELMSKSVEEQVSIIQEALNSGDMTALKNIPVERQSVRPKLSSFLVSLGYQYEYNDDNTFVLSSTQYIDDMISMNGTNKLYHSMNLEWHKQYDRYTKFISVFSMGLSTLSSRFSISRNIDPRTTIDINLYFNFMDTFWKTFLNLFQNNYQHEEESAADLFDNVFSDDNSSGNKGEKSYLYVLPELLTVFKNSVKALYNFVVNGSNVLYNTARDPSLSLYPGFDISFGLRRFIFNEWMGISSIRLGRTPSFSWSILKNMGAKHWHFGVDIGRNTLGLLFKHEKNLEKAVKFYISLGFDVTNILKFECGFSKLLIDQDLQDMIDNLKSKANDEHNLVSSIDMSTSFGIDISLRQGISMKLGLKRGPSQFNVPIKLAESPSSLKQIMLSFGIPIITYFGYKWYYKPYSIQLYDHKIRQTLNEKGLLLFNKRKYALKQQSIMIKESNKNQKLEMNKNGLIILCAFYGDNVEMKLFDAIRKYLNLDEEEDDDEDDLKKDDDEEEKYENEEEKQMNDDSVDITDDGNNNNDNKPPPLLFDIHNRYSAKYDKQNEERPKKYDTESRLKKIKKRYHIKICDVDWLSIENDLENLMKHDENEDVHLLSFINVRTVLQYMVNNNESTLTLSSGSKSYLPGFYDCCPDDRNTMNKQLFIIYKYNNDQYKYVTISDIFPLTLPNKSHLEWFNCRHSVHH